MTSPNIESFEPSIPERVDSLLLLSSVVNRFIDVKRATIRNGKPETDGEHTLHLQSLAVAYAAEYHPGLDLGRVSLYSLAHDFIEVYAGDVNSLKATPEEIATKALQEKLAFDKLKRELGGVWPAWINLIERYELLADSEARFVKVFDKCDPAFSHLKNGGEVLLSLGIATSEEYRTRNSVVRERMEYYADEFPDVLAIREELQSRIAAALYSDV